MTHLVDNGNRLEGRFEERPVDVNPLDAFTGVARRLKWLRLKEWVGFTLVHPDLWSSLIVQDAHYLASAESYVCDRATGHLAQYAATKRGGSVGMTGELFGSRFGFRSKGYQLEYAFDKPGGTHRIRVDIAATKEQPALTGELELDDGGASAPLSVSAPLPGGDIYTHKVIYPASGVLRRGDTEFTFDGSRDFAILDEHKSFLPYRTKWMWGTFAARDGDGIVGSNFCERAISPGAEDESCLWTPHAAEELSGVVFERESGDPLSPWRARSADGGLDVRFEPAGRKEVRHQLGLFAIDYFQLFGTWSGTLRGADREYSVDQAHGVCESMNARL